MNKNDYQKMIGTALGKEKNAGRAARDLFFETNPEDERMLPYLNEILDSLLRIKNGQLREWLRILEQFDLAEEQEGRMFDLCISTWKDCKQIPSTRAVAYRILTATARKYPEIIPEILLLAEGNYLETLSPGIKRSVIRFASDLRAYNAGFLPLNSNVER